MADYYALTRSPLPIGLYGVDPHYSIRALSDRERLAVEDYIFTRDQIKVTLDPSVTAIVVPRELTSNSGLEDFAVLVEFAFGVLALAGFQSVLTVAVFNDSICVDVLQRACSEPDDTPTFSERILHKPRDVSRSERASLQ